MFKNCEDCAVLVTGNANKQHKIVFLTLGKVGTVCLCCPLELDLAKQLINATTLINPAIPATAAGLNKNAAGSIAMMVAVRTVDTKKKYG